MKVRALQGNQKDKNKRSILAYIKNSMTPKPVNQSLKYNPLLLPKEHKNAIQLANIDLWNELGRINLEFPKAQINVDHFVKEFGNYYAIDLRLRSRNKNVQKLLIDIYERTMRLPRFEKHEHFQAMISDF